MPNVVAKSKVPNQRPQPDTPGVNAQAVSPSDTDELTYICKGFYVGVTGDVTAILANDTAFVLFKAMPVGYYPISLRQIKNTGTTATNIVAVS